MNRQRPPLKNGVDLQLQSAFNDGNWAIVIRLAEKRARTFNDQYYQVRQQLETETHFLYGLSKPWAVELTKVWRRR